MLNRAIRAALLSALAALLWGCASAPDEPYYTPSTAEPFDFAKSSKFED
jgi:type IV pilus biogenesis protein CpaD/CtpE